MRALRDVDPKEHGARLREILSYTAAALVSTEGAQAASEAVYRIGDAVIGVER